MATASQANAQEGPREQVVVVIGLDQNGEIFVQPNNFWVHKSEYDEGQWFCLRSHNHHDPDDPCFTVEFDPLRSPFSTSTFKNDRIRSGLPVVPPSSTRYKYSVRIGSKTLDPGGGVRG